ncbi:hypothetical protein AVEN_82436-1 [Araneus ventricosus]|uniref:Uncharacterized protein n=1 Tax=Araneus ventricosus TaxID=182803 RepID=A0A4Y2GW48_ARAVE|nr:hypothetical protein AVEN_82436-1 [Araneus ventricosus]
MYGVNSPTRRMMQNEGPLTNVQENTQHRQQETTDPAQTSNANRQQLTGNKSSALLDPSAQTVSKPLPTTIAAPSTELSPPTP